MGTAFGSHESVSIKSSKAKQEISISPSKKVALGLGGVALLALLAGFAQNESTTSLADIVRKHPNQWIDIGDKSHGWRVLKNKPREH